jgi:transcriptional regulator with XRE-family HTH domain
MASPNERLAAWRLGEGLTLVAAAELLGTKWWRLRRYENGERSPDISFAVAAQRVVGIPVEAWAKSEAA